VEAEAVMQFKVAGVTEEKPLTVALIVADPGLAALQVA
jgi:hypothetical protein